MQKEQEFRPGYRTLRLILGDQLDLQHSWFKTPDPEILYVIMEIRPESEYVTHHIQKIAGIFSAMRRFRDILSREGHAVCYLSITDPENRHDFEDNLRRLADRFQIKNAEWQEPDEFRLDKGLRSAFSGLGIPVEMVPSEHFYTGRNDLAECFKGRDQYLMETFYHHMRRKFGVLMDSSGQPEGGKWNYDKSNRNRLPKDIPIPEPFTCRNDVSEAVQDIETAGLEYIGKIDPPNFVWPLDRVQALDALNDFIERLLPDFGTYQDALADEHWSLFHSRISFALNLKLLRPAEVVDAVEAAWRENGERVSIEQAEGFIRQILGWREFMRGIYWAQMPDYAESNFFGAERSLPEYFWNGDTKMRCVSRAVSQSLEHGYAHHIQRLMVTGNFCALAGINPDAVDRWYLGIYVDAFEWVEITNTRGMSQYADGGIIGTKPYVSSASYIQKMGDHCSRCFYDHRKRSGERSCPFNSLYWHFIVRNREQLERNPRMGMMYRVWERMNDADKKNTIDQADSYLENIEGL